MGLADYRDLGVSKLLRSAEQQIHKFGWTQGAVRAEDGRIDISGAILIAAYVKPKLLRAQTFVDPETLVPPAKISVALGALYVIEGLVGDIPRWNDEPGRTVQEVRNLLLHAADLIDIAVT